MKAALLAAKQEWQVSANWYDDRLDGRVSNEDAMNSPMCASMKPYGTKARQS